MPCFNRTNSDDNRAINSCSSFTDHQEAQNTQPAYKMIDYPNLPSFKSDIQPGEVIQKTQIDFEAKDWMDHFKAIDTLRVLNKYYNKEVNDIFKNFWKYILSAMNDVKTAMQMNILLFIREVFEHSE